MTRCDAVYSVRALPTRLGSSLPLYGDLVPDEKSEIEPFDPDAITAEYVYMRMADHVVARIKAGQLPPGARLEGERAMADEYGVALGTVRRAIRELVERGWVVTLPAKGTFVKLAEEWPEATG